MSIITGTIHGGIIEGTSEDDTILGLDGNDTLIGYGGDDFMSGGAGNNFFDGGDGNDTYLSAGHEDVVSTGIGHDLIDLSESPVGHGFLGIMFHSEAQGIFVLVDGERDVGLVQVDNGLEPEGLVFFKDLNNALQVESSHPVDSYHPLDGTSVHGVLIAGTGYDDEFMIDLGSEGRIRILPGAGDDTIHINGTTGIVRLAGLSGGNGTNGIVADLKSGLITKGGSGTVRITGDGHVTVLEGTFRDDIIQGSGNDEDFVLSSGNDFLAGGAGVDTIWYDYPDVSSLMVNLSKGSATGTWVSGTFTHTLKGIENIRGSLEFDDILVGNGKDNLIEGKGGNDVIRGKRGDDTLFGQEGFDKFVFKNNDGNDYIGDFDAFNSQEKIKLKDVTEITDFDDLMANHVTYNGSQTVINDSAGLVITLVAVDIADLDNSDFIF